MNLIQHFNSLEKYSLPIRAQKKGKEFPELSQYSKILFSELCQVEGEDQSTDSRDVEETLYKGREPASLSYILQSYRCLKRISKDPEPRSLWHVVSVWLETVSAHEHFIYNR